MAKFDELFPIAIQELGERGLLLNAHLVRLVGGDQQLLQTIREALIADGLAQDRYGVGLAKCAEFDTRRATSEHRRITNVEVIETPDVVVFGEASHDDGDWWLMSGGSVSGPLSLEALIQMRRLGEMSDIDMVREGVQGLWLIPKDVAELAEITPTKRTASRKPATTSVSIAAPVELRPEPQRIASSARREAVIPAAHQSASGMARPISEDGIEYFLWDAGQSVGPIGKEELQERLESNQIEEDDFVQVGRDGDWQPLSLALGAPRPPLLIPLSALYALKEGSSDGDVVARPSPLPAAISPPPVQVAPKGQAKPSASLTKQTDEPTTASPIIRGWIRASHLVGGQSRLSGILVATACSIALVIWLRQPPAPGVIYQELEATHQKLRESRRLQPGSNKPVKVASEDLERIVAIKDGLAKRASADRPAIQELLWACEYGLVPMMEQPYGSQDLERVFADHMSRAGQLIDPNKVVTEQMPLAEPVEVPTE